MKKTIVIVGIIVAALAIAAAVYFIFLRGEPVEKEVALTTYSPGEYFVTNVKDSKRLLKISVVLGLDNDKMTEQLKEKNYIIRDAIIFVLRDVTEEKFNSDNVKDQLGNEIRDKLNEVLETESIQQIWFGDFVMQ